VIVAHSGRSFNVWSELRGKMEEICAELRNSAEKIGGRRVFL
jgi:hypothetical protein